MQLTSKVQTPITFLFVNMLILSQHEMKYIAEKSKFSFYFIPTEMQKAQPNFFLGRFSFDLTFAVFIGYSIGCKRSLHLVNGLESYFNE